jgi:hypothetical protein
MQTLKPTQTKTKISGQTDSLEYIKLIDPKLYLRWYLDEYQFIKVDLIKVRA